MGRNNYESPGQMDQWNLKHTFSDASMPTHFRVLMKEHRKSIIKHEWLQIYVKERIETLMESNPSFTAFYKETLVMLEEIIESPPPVPPFTRNKKRPNPIDVSKENISKALKETPPPPPDISVEDQIAAFKPLRLVMKEHVLYALSLTKNVTRSAEILGISIRTMRNYMKEYNVDRNLATRPSTIREEQIEASNMIAVEKKEAGETKRIRKRNFHSNAAPTSAVCHPERAHYVRGLCFACYKRRITNEP